MCVRPGSAPRAVPSRPVAAALAAIAAAACFHSTAPPGFLPSPQDTETEAHGAWIVVERPQGVLVQGELIAIGADSIYVLGADSLRVLDRAGAIQGTLTWYRPDLSSLQAWTVYGMISTASHGYGVILTAPIWAIAGAVTTADYSRAALIETSDYDSLRPYARFPQGLPASLDRRSLRPTSAAASARR